MTSQENTTQQSEYIVSNRALIEGVKHACSLDGITYTSFSDEWIVRLQKGTQTRFISGFSFDYNNQASCAIAVDKVATYQLLADAHIPAVPHHLLKSIADTSIDRSSLDWLIEKYQEIVVKPLRGLRGRGVAKFDTIDQAFTFMNQKSFDMWAASPFIDVDRELRLVVFKDKVQLAYEKTEPAFRNGLKLFNLNLGAKAMDREVESLDRSLTDLAIKASQTLNLPLVAVDIIIDTKSQALVLEVNSSFSLEHYALTEETYRKKAVDFYSHVVQSMF